MPKEINIRVTINESLLSDLDETYGRLRPGLRIMRKDRYQPEKESRRGDKGYSAHTDGTPPSLLAASQMLHVLWISR